MKVWNSHFSNSWTEMEAMHLYPHGYWCSSVKAKYPFVTPPNMLLFPRTLSISKLKIMRLNKLEIKTYLNQIRIRKEKTLAIRPMTRIKKIWTQSEARCIWVFKQTNQLIVHDYLHISDIRSESWPEPFLYLSDGP